MRQALPESHVRPPAVSGVFYPEDPLSLRQMVEQSLSGAMAPLDADEPAPRALIAPHAGYVYSGAAAAAAYARLQHAKQSIQRVVLIGPAHRVSFSGLAASSAVAFATPLGDVPIDRLAVDDLLDLSFVHLLDQAHAMEHSLEVHLPFLQTILAEFSIVPLTMGDVSPSQIQQVFERLYDDQTLLLVSSDLSHFHDYDQARRLDEATSRAIEALEPTRIEPQHACGQPAVVALLAFAKKHALRPRCVDLRNSGDAAGQRDRVVGYGAYVFDPAVDAHAPH